MNIDESRVQIVVSYQDLKRLVREIMEECNAENKKADELWTARDVCEHFNISLPTLWRWGKMGYLVPIKVGKKKLYRKSDIDNL